MNPRTLFVLPIAALWLIGCHDNPTAHSVVVESPPPDVNQSAPVLTDVESETKPMLHQFGDFSFAIPDGWTIAAPDRDKTKAMILLGGETWQNAQAMIKVDVGMPAAPTAEQLAQGFAEGTGGTVNAEPMNFDGTPGVSVSSPSKTLAAPQRLIVIYRDERAYLLVAGAVEGVELADAIAHIRDTWTWAQQPNGQ